MKQRAVVIISLLMFLFLIPASLKADEPTVASVAIINYQNKSENPDYNWIAKMLSDTVFSIMREAFDFRRVDQVAIDAAVGIPKAGGFVPNEKNMGELAKNSNTDIIISGVYTFDQDKNIVKVTTIVYHASRKKITAKIKTEHPMGDRMLRMLDLAGMNTVEHVKKIAIQDYKRQELALDESQLGKNKRLTLIKYVEPVVKILEYSDWYMNISNSMIFMLGPIAKAAPYGFDVKLNFTSSYRDIFIYGGTFSYAMVFPLDSTTVFAPAGMTVIDLRGIAGLNFGIKQKVYIQPYVGVGGALQILALQKIVPTGTNPPFKTTTEYQYLGDVSMSVGIRFPIRMASYDLFVTPFFEFCAFPFHNNFIGYIQAGVGINL